MDHRDHVELLRGGVEPAGPGGADWGDLGSGAGAFTLALADLLGPGGRILSVDRDRGALREYDADHGNPWVPHPLSFATWRRVAVEAGLIEPRLLGRVPSRFLGAIYSSLAELPR